MALTLVRYVLTAALRDKLFLSVLVMLAVITSLSVMMASTAIIESGQFALVFTAGSLRLVGNLGLVLFIIFFMRRAFDSGDIDFILSRPISRASFIISHSIAIIVLSALIGMFCLLALFMVAPHAFTADTLFWTASYFLELVIIGNAALFFSLMLSSVPAAAFAVLGLYVLGRMIGELLGIAHRDSLGQGLVFLNYTLEAISWVTPRLDLLAQTSWLLYGRDAAINFAYVIVQGCVFTGILITASIIDLMRKEF